MLQAYSTLKKLCPIAMLVLFSSCAAIFNSKSTTVNIHTYPEKATIILNQKDTFCCNVDLFKVNRSGYPLTVQVKKDSLQKTVYVSPILSSTYALPNLLNFWFYGGGYFIDLASRKRFTYPKDVYINLNRKDNKYSTDADNQLLNLVIHVPIINTYNFSIAKQILTNLTDPYSGIHYSDTIGGQSNTWGLLGLSGSMEFYLNKNYYLSGNMGFYPKSTFFVYSAPDRDYRYMSLSINRRFNRYHIGAGLGWERLSYANDPYSENAAPIGNVYTDGYTLRLEAQYQLSDSWYLSTNYQPIIIRDKRSDASGFNFWGLELNYKIPLATINREFPISN